MSSLVSMSDPLPQWRRSSLVLPPTVSYYFQTPKPNENVPEMRSLHSKKHPNKLQNKCCLRGDLLARLPDADDCSRSLSKYPFNVLTSFHQSHNERVNLENSSLLDGATCSMPDPLQRGTNRCSAASFCGSGYLQSQSNDRRDYLPYHQSHWA
jgi:hypothetical protein